MKIRASAGSVVPSSYLTAGKEYEVVEGYDEARDVAWIKDDDGTKILVALSFDCMHLNLTGHFEIVEEST